MIDPIIDVDFNFDNSYAQQLKGFYMPCQGEKAPAPQLIKLNRALAKSLGLELDNLQDAELANIFSGSVSPKGATPLAQVYAGHQFGGFSPQLGDGRALLIGEIVDSAGSRRDIHLKGSGQTPFSRGGDGKAVLGPVLREYIIGEAMHALNIPTTRALAAVSTGEKVMRSKMQSGAVLARVALSHIRVGTFQFFAARNEIDKVKQLADYTIQRHFPELKTSETPYLGLLCAVRDKQAALVAKWLLVGFVHGVMNTDNMTVSGETIDYGPCAFMDQYDPNAVFSSIDRNGRYAYSKQPMMAQWNLARLAEALLPLIDSNEGKAIRFANDAVNAFSGIYEELWLTGMRAKLGLVNIEKDDLTLVSELYDSMEGQSVDFTLLFRYLSETLQGDTDIAQHLFHDSKKFDRWFLNWSDRLARDPIDVEVRKLAMNNVNPLYIPRNHMVEAALQAAENDSNFEPFETLLNVLKKPFSRQKGREEYEKPAPISFGPYKTFCGT